MSMTKTTRPIAIAALLLCAAAAPARAQDWPADDEWEPFHCGDANMYDDVADEAGAIDERDVVGDELQPAGLHFADGDFAYLRLRLEEDPAETPGGDLRPFAWGFEFDTDGDLTTYEVLVLASGIDQTVSVFSNDVITLDNDPSDPADDPPVAVYDWVDAGRTVAAGSDFGGDGDTYLDMAVLWDDLEAVGLDPLTPIITWAASSSQDNTLDGDFACHDGTTGEPFLDEIGSDEDTVVDPDQDSDGDGFSDGEEIDAGSDPDDPNSVPDGEPGSGDTELEGGGGCSVGPSGSPGWLAALLLLLAVGSRQRRRRI